MMQLELGFMEPTWLSRLIREQSELNERLIKLTEFKAGKDYLKLSLDERRDMTDQHYFMSGYLTVLDKRIARAKEISNG